MAAIYQIHEISESAAKWVELRTLALYRRAPAGNFVFQGSGVLLKISTSAFVLTAAHVVTFLNEPADRGTTLWAASMEAGMQRMIQLHRTPVTYTQNDDYDIAFILLSDEIAESLGRHKQFLRLNEVERGTALVSGAYCVLGYPARENTPNYQTRDLDPTPFRYMTVLDENAPEIKPGVSLVVKWTKRTLMHSHKGEIRMPELRGISGCGIWRIFSTEQHSKGLERWNESLIRLAAIEHRTVEHKRIRGTIVAHALAIIGRTYPDLDRSMRLVTAT